MPGKVDCAKMEGLVPRSTHLTPCQWTAIQASWHCASIKSGVGKKIEAAGTTSNDHLCKRIP
jgi:hypothetical protein